MELPIGIVISFAILSVVYPSQVAFALTKKNKQYKLS